jgi:apolipoprotein N-acyltransferase
MNRVTADRALFQSSCSVFWCQFWRAKRRRPAVSLERIETPVNQNLENLHRGEELEEVEKCGRIGSRGLILAEELVGIFDEADDHNDGGAGHADEEHDLKNVHRNQTNLEHKFDCSVDCLPFPCARLVLAWFWPLWLRTGLYGLRAKLLFRCELERGGGESKRPDCVAEVRESRRRSATLSPMRGIPWRLLAAAALTAILLDLPFPLAGPLPVWRTIFAWFALVPLLVALLRFSRISGGRLRSVLGWSFLAGWLTGALWFGSNCYWVYNTMHLYGGMNDAMAVVCLVSFSLYLGFWFGAFALVLAVIRRATVGRRFAWVGVAAIPFLWTAMEFAIARIPQFPWDQLGYSQVDNGLLTQLASWTGVYGISFLLAGVNALFALSLVSATAEAKRHEAYFSISRYCGELGLAIAFVGCAGFLMHPQKPAAAVYAVLIQPNLDVAADDVWVGPEWDRHIAQFGQLSREVCDHGYIAGIPETHAPQGRIECGPNPVSPSLVMPSLVIWPESPAPFRDADPRFRDSMASIAQADKVPLIVGDIGMDEDAEHRFHFYNSASVIAAEGHFTGRYDKIHLVPFGEYVPFRKLLFFVHQLTEQLSDMGSGSDRRTFAIGGHRYGIFICYESVFGDEVRQFVRHGAEVLVNISDDGWYGDTSAPWQHLNMARMRAIENRRWILRDTNNGTTASIDPYGTVRQSIPRHAVDALPAGYGFNSELTFYTVHGDWLPAICAILSLALLVWSGRVVLGQTGLGEISSEALAKLE